MNPILLISLIGGAYFLLRNVNTTNITNKTAQVSLTGVRINTSNILAPYFELTFNIWNTVNTNITLQAISGAVYYQGNPVANIQYADTKQILKGSNFITVKAVPNSLQIINTIISLIGGKFTKDLTVRGNAVLNGVAVPIEMAI